MHFIEHQHILLRLTCCGMLQIQPLTTFLPAAARLVAIGDLHGDMSKTRRAFKTAGLIDSQDRWTGGTTTAVQVLHPSAAEIWLTYQAEIVLCSQLTTAYTCV